ncbi:MAG: ABC transporter permease subunit [Verrucomicrobiota bacterium]
MNFLPVISRELQVQARQPATHRARWVAAGVVMGLWVFLMLMGGRNAPEARAHLLFLIVGFSSLGFVMLAGVFQTADCLSRERREGTLGLMFLTDLKGYDVVLGKLASTSLQSFYTFLAVVPVLALTFLLGGIMWGEFWRVTLVLVATLYFSLAVGMLVSSFSRDARVAMGGTIVLLATMGGLIPILWWLAVGRNANGAGTATEFLLWGCPPYAFRLAWYDAYSTTPGAAGFWNCILMFLGLGTAGLAVASWVLPNSWQDHKQSRAIRAEVFQPRPLSTQTAARRRSWRDHRPLFWLTTRDSRPRRMVGTAFIVLLPFWVFSLLQVGMGSNPTQRTATVVALGITYCLHLIVKCLVAAEASRLLSEDRHNGTLELLLVSPLSVESIVTAQLRGIWYSFRKWVVILTVMNLAVILFTVQADVFQNNVEFAAWVTLTMAGGAVLLFVDGCAIMNVGMWMALVKKNYAHAFMATVMRVLLPPWLLGAFFFILVMGGGGMGAVAGIMVIWFILCFVMNVCLALPTLRKLHRQFRSVVALGNVKVRETPNQAEAATAMEST